MLIRQALPADLEEILLVFEKSIREIPETLYNNVQKEEWIKKGLSDKSRWETRINNQYFLIAEQKGTITGIGSLEVPDHIDVLYVHPNYQHQKVATNILNMLEEFAVFNGTEKISTDASKAAVSFFKAFGYRIIKPSEVIINSQYLRNFSMLKTM